MLEIPLGMRACTALINGMEGRPRVVNDAAACITVKPSALTDALTHMCTTAFGTTASTASSTGAGSLARVNRTEQTAGVPSLSSASSSRAPNSSGLRTSTSLL